MNSFRIGLRTIKTAISIFICLMLFLLLKLISKIEWVSDDLSNMIYNPFFAGIATAYSVSATKTKSIEQAKNRSIASVIGGLVGILIVFLYEIITNKAWPLIGDADIVSFIIPYILSTICAIIVILVCLFFKKPGAIFISILTLLSVTINPSPSISSTYGIWLFGLNRILSTIVGVFVALGVNLFRLPHMNKNKDLLFAIDIDSILKNDSETIKGYMNYKLNKVYDLGINTTFFTTRAPHTFMHLLDDVNINNPIICMSGAALYDAKSLKYIYQEKIDNDVVKKIDKILNENNVSYFKNTIIDDSLNITYNMLDDVSRLYYDSKKNIKYANIYKGCHDETLYYLILNNKEKNDEIEALLKELDNDIEIQRNDVKDEFKDLDNLEYLKIYSKKINDLTGIKNYLKEKDMRLVSMSYENKYSYFIEAASFYVTKEKTNTKHYLKNESPNSLFEMINKIYYSKLYKKEVD